MFFANKNEDDQTKDRFSIDAKLVGFLSGVAFLGIVLVIMTLLSAETISALRSYSTAQTHWTEAREQAVSNLRLYSATGEKKYFENYRENMRILEKAEQSRIELMSEQTDPQRIMSLLEHFQFRDGEIRSMITMYNRLGGLYEFNRVLELWDLSDQYIEELDSIATRLHPLPPSGAKSGLDKEKMMAHVASIDNRFTDLQFEMASVLDQGTQRLVSIIFWSAMGSIAILIGVGGLMSRRFLRSIHKWEHALKMNTQRYQSLFDENPNAVFSFDREGVFEEGNKALEKMLATSRQQLKTKTFDQFVVSAEREKVRSKFKKAASGNPQTYETVGQNARGEEFHIQVTNLPIYVDDEIVGVYGIAQDIEERVQAQKKVESQLEERTVLLSEIHHRVKNNLAFVSSMLILQEDNIQNEQAQQQLQQAQNRIISIADIHEIFYNTENFSELGIKQYAEQILNRLFRTFELEGKTIDYHIEADDDISLTMNEAIPFGLILNELAINSYKHAFAETENGEIGLSVKSNNGEVQVSYHDNGDGLPEDFEFGESAQSSLGMRLIYTFLQQLDADFEIPTGAGEFRLEFTFKV